MSIMALAMTPIQEMSRNLLGFVASRKTKDELLCLVIPTLLLGFEDNASFADTYARERISEARVWKAIMANE